MAGSESPWGTGGKNLSTGSQTSWPKFTTRSSQHSHCQVQDQEPTQIPWNLNQFASNLLTWRAKGRDKAKGRGRNSIKQSWTTGQHQIWPNHKTIQNKTKQTITYVAKFLRRSGVWMTSHGFQMAALRQSDIGSDRLYTAGAIPSALAPDESVKYCPIRIHRSGLTNCPAAFLDAWPYRPKYSALVQL